MRLLPFLYLFIFVVIFTVALVVIDLPFSLIYIVIFVVYPVLFIFPQMFIVYKSNDLIKIERFLEKNKRNPTFNYALAIKTRNREEIIRSIKMILSKYKQPYVQQVYKTKLAFYENNVSLFEQRAKQISKEPFRTYYIIYAEVLNANFHEAQSLKEKLPVGWMPYAIDAIIAKEKDDFSAFRKAAEQSIHLARGVQKFNLFYSFEWMEKEMTHLIRKTGQKKRPVL